jgi:hypothetical protein
MSSKQRRGMFARLKGRVSRPKELTDIKRQTGARTKPTADKRYKAMHPGKRVSKYGKVYYETRRDRSDKNKTKKI